MKSDRNHNDYLKDILEEIKKVSKYIEGMTFKQFRDDEKTIYAVIRAIEVIGEASKKIPDNIRQSQPVIPWREISGMRDKLIHDYFGINVKVVWKTATEDLLEIEPIICNMISS
jgi:uncharacterized protein with HEPN domain